MTVNYREDRILARASELRPGDIDRLNKILEDAGIGRPLRHPEAGSAAAGVSDLAVLPVVGADPMAVRDAVRAFIRQGGGELPTLVLDSQYNAGTVEDGARETDLFDASGKKSGHGTIAWLPAPAYEMPDTPPGPHGHPVIALLDSGVQPHDWLSADGDPPFVIDAAEKYGWSAPGLGPDPGKEPVPRYGSHWGHATFIAGLIRLTAPDAQLLSMRVMNIEGKVSESDVVNALEWLADPDHHPDLTVDIVLMCFGRQADAGDHDLDLLRGSIKAFSSGNVRFVASAGNNGAETPVYPAAFAAEQGLPVVSVGALATPTQRAPYSNSGPWVQEWRKGTNILSVMPLTTKNIGGKRVTAQAASDAPDVTATGNGYAWWSGTSFAAAIYAGQLAQRMSAAQVLPEPGAAP
jgi:hypothetical protein